MYDLFVHQYGWWTLGILLLIAEILVPGIFLMWFGLAALLTGVVDWLFPALAWQWLAVLFAAVSLALVFGLRPLVSRRLEEETDHPDLNRRLHAQVGQTATLIQPIENGHGKVKIGDTFWRVTGPDLPAETRVKVVSVDESAKALAVKPLDAEAA